MKVVYNQDEQKVPIKLWLDDMEESAMKQAYNLSKLPFAFKHIAIMSDAHLGYGMPIGGVLATKRVVIPNAVGVDIGCGMCAVKTSLKTKQMDKETLKKIMGKIREVVPVGNGKGGSHKERQDPNLLSNKFGKITYQEFGNVCNQIGTLGGGNHFIEIQKDLEDNIWIMIHSGSRNLGYKVANHYNKLATELNERYYSKVDKEWELAFLVIGTEEYNNYLTEMKYCVDFALANRKLMMERIQTIFHDFFENHLIGLNGEKTYLLDKAIINIAHNYASLENHFDQNVMVHRKGATLARKDTIGIIPGSQGSKSYIVKGLGNPESFMSCSHGAGRKMGRKQAQKTLNLEDEIKQMNDKGIIHGIRGVKDLDEAAGAYKDIDIVMENQKDLVKIVTELLPLAVIKG